MEENKSIPLVQYLKTRGDGILIERLKEVTISEEYPEMIASHKHDYFTCLLPEKGSIEIMVDFRRITVNKHKLLLLCPGQVHQFVKASPLTAYYLSLDSFLITDQARDILEQSLAEDILVKLTEKESEWFRSLLALMINSQNDGEETEVNVHTIQTLATAFIIQATSIYQAKEQCTTIGHSVNQVAITKKFRQLVRQNFKELKRPSDYADMMNLSVSYLNDTVKKVSSFSLSHFIQHEITLEAKRLLCDSELSIKAIGISLGYEDYKYFNRLFSKVIGIPPGEFRENHKRKIS